MPHHGLFTFSGVSGTQQLYAHETKVDGTDGWTAGGTTVSSSMSLNVFESVSDTANGQIVVWAEAGVLKAQRYNASGVAQWATVTIVSTYALGNGYGICPDGVGGVIIVWPDNRLGGSFNIFAQRLNSSGAAVWTANGVTVCNAANIQYSPKVTLASSGDPILFWNDERGASGTFHIFAQRLTLATGAGAWTANGVAITTGGAVGQKRTSAAIAANASGGACLVWGDNDSAFTTFFLYTQLVNTSGVTQWTANGVKINGTAADSGFNNVNIAHNGNGEFFIGFPYSLGATQAARVSRFSSAGVSLWGQLQVGNANTNAGVQVDVTTSDGCWVCWRGSDISLRLQKTDNLGSVLLGGSGMEISGAQASANRDYGMIADGDDQVVFGFAVLNGASRDFYAQRLTSAGTLAYTSPGALIKTAYTSSGGSSRVIDIVLGEFADITIVVPPAAADSRAGLENNIRLLIDDRDKDKYVISSLKMVQLMNAHMQAIALRIFIPFEALYSTPLAQGGVFLDGACEITRVMLDYYHTDLERISLEDMILQYRLGADNEVKGVPQAYALGDNTNQGTEESSSQTFIYLAPVPTFVQALGNVKIWYSLIPARLTAENSTVPFPDPLLRAMERYVAADCVVSMTDGQRASRMLDPRQAIMWRMDADQMIRDENFRLRVTTGATQDTIAAREDQPQCL